MVTHTSTETPTRSEVFTESLARNKRPAAICATGAAGNGKSTLLELLESILCSKQSEQAAGLVVRVEMSKIIVWGSKLHGPLGKLVNEHKHLVIAGRYLPDYVISPLFDAWMDDQSSRRRRPAETFLLGGLPRTTGQLEETQKHFSRIVVIDQDVDKTTSFKSIRTRLEKAARAGENIRPDDLGGENVLEERWNEHCTHTPRIAEALNGNMFRLKRADPLPHRLNHIFEQFKKMGDHSPIPQQVVRKCLERLRQRSHPIHTTIHKIENPEVVQMTN